MKNKVSWKTTVFGALGAIGLALTSSTNPTLHTVGTLLAALGVLAGGAAGKDYNVTGNGTTDEAAQ
jgi:hypothetical protein